MDCRFNHCARSQGTFSVLIIHRDKTVKALERRIEAERGSKFGEALATLKGAFVKNKVERIFRYVYRQMTDEHLLAFASLLNNLAFICKNKSRPDRAKQKFDESLKIYSSLAGKYQGELQYEYPYAESLIRSVAHFNYDESAVDTAKQILFKIQGYSWGTASVDNC